MEKAAAMFEGRNVTVRKLVGLYNCILDEMKQRERERGKSKVLEC